MKKISSFFRRSSMHFDDLDKRMDEYKRNEELEKYLYEINLCLKDSEIKLINEKTKEYPIVFIMGSLRSGTTLLEQWLASTGEFAYPSNLLSRFYGVPIIGSKIVRLLTETKYNFRNEIMDFKGESTYESSNGKTQGALEPNEFWYFWRRFLPEDIWNYNDEQLMKYVDINTMTKEMWGIAREFDKPLALKGLICNYNIGFLNSIFSKALFIWIRRDLEKTVQSVLKARERQYGTSKQWYSFRIPEYEDLMMIDDMEEQVRGQINCINNAVKKGLEKVKDEKKICINYEDFCRSPEKLYFEIHEKLRGQGYSINKRYFGKREFTIR